MHSCVAAHKFEESMALPSGPCHHINQILPATGASSFISWLSRWSLIAWIAKSDVSIAATTCAAIITHNLNARKELANTYTCCIHQISTGNSKRTWQTGTAGWLAHPKPDLVRACPMGKMLIVDVAPVSDRQGDMAHTGPARC